MHGVSVPGPFLSTSVMRSFALLLALAALAAVPPAREDAPAPNAARFDWFEYTGRDAVYDARRPGSSDYLNPILCGVCPDRSLERAGAGY